MSEIEYQGRRERCEYIVMLVFLRRFSVQF